MPETETMGNNTLPYKIL